MLGGAGRQTVGEGCVYGVGSGGGGCGSRGR